MNFFLGSILQVFFLIFVVQNVSAHEIELEAIVVDDDPILDSGVKPYDIITEYDFEEYYFDIGVAGFYGENISGDWTLEVINWESGGCPEETDDDGNVTSVCTTGTLENWGIIAYGN